MRDYRRKQRPCVVIVEPDADSRELYAQYFKWVGVQAVTVPRAADALRILSHDARAAVITCLRLPGMDGFALCEALHAKPRTSRIPVIGISTSLPDHERAVRASGFAMVLMKPCLPDVLLDALRGTLAA